MYLSLACPFFNISCQLEVNWICNYIPKVPQITGVPEKVMHFDQ